MARARALEVAAPKRRVREPQIAYVMTAPGGPDHHRHCAAVKSDGRGRTAPGPDGHVHQVDGLEVLAADDGHSHGMSAQRCQSEHQRGRCLR